MSNSMGYGTLYCTCGAIILRHQGLPDYSARIVRGGCRECQNNDDHETATLESWRRTVSAEPQPEIRNNVLTFVAGESLRRGHGISINSRDGKVYHWRNGSELFGYVPRDYKTGEPVRLECKR